MTADNYNFKVPKANYKCTKFSVVGRVINLGPLASGFVVGVLAYLILSLERTSKELAIPLSLVVAMLIASVSLWVASILEKRTLRCNSWLQDSIDRAIVCLNTQIIGELKAYEQNTKNLQLEIVSSGVIGLRDLTTVYIHPVSKELIEMKLQLAALNGISATERLNISRFGFELEELRSWNPQSGQLQRAHLICYLDVPQVSLDDFNVYTARSSDVVGRLLAIASAPISEQITTTLAKGRFRDLVDQLATVADLSSEPPNSTLSDRNERASATLGTHSQREHSEDNATHER
jgi:hypothetical protein